MIEAISSLISKFKKTRAEFEKLEQDIPRIIGNESVKVIRENFKLQGYDSGSGVSGWQPRNEKTNKAYDRRGKLKGSVYNSSNPLLMQSRNLYRSIRYSAKAKQVLIGVDPLLIPYAKKMNEERKYIPADGEPANNKIMKKCAKKIESRRDLILKEYKK